MSDDNRMVLRIYAWLASIGGIFTTLFLWSRFGYDLPGLQWGMASLQRVIGVLIFASGCWAAQLSQIANRDLRRKAFRWFAAAHTIVLLILKLQSIAIWPPEITSNLDVGIKILFGLVLFMFLQSENYFADPNDNLSVSSRDIRATYEQQIRETGAQEERNRLARDLHDSIKQQIFVVRTAAATAQTRFDTDRDGAAAALEQVRESARDAMTEMEVMIDQLRAVPLENTTLVAALKKQCEALEHRTGAHVEFVVGELPANETIAPGSHQVILRVAQEACANIGRHARAKNVTVSLALTATSLELRIQDDGVGFELLRSHAGMGISNMHARAKESGGQFHIASSPGHGVTLAFNVPWKAHVAPSRLKRHAQQLLVHMLAFAGIIAFLPPDFRQFSLSVWGGTGAIRIYHAIRTHRRELAARTA